LLPPRKRRELVDGTSTLANKCIFIEMQKAAGQLATGPCWSVTACLALLLSACPSTRAQPSSEGELRSARLEALEAKVEHLSDELAPRAVSAAPNAPRGAPVPTTPAAPSAPPAMADRALLKAAGAPRAASLTKAEAHSFIRLKSSIERANAAARKGTRRSP
jgi:hypothetical protein